MLACEVKKQDVRASAPGGFAFKPWPYPKKRHRESK